MSILIQNKNKLKIDINKALQTINNIVKPTDTIKETIESSFKQLNIDKTDKPHKCLMDDLAQREFLISDHNKDAKSNNYRSPYSNTYFPVHHEDMFLPSPLLRDFQEKGNLLFQEYARMYYGEQGCISNFYVFETEEGLNFTSLIKKIYKDKEFYGVISTYNLVQIRGDPVKNVTYKLQSTLVYELTVLNEANNQLLEIFGSLKKSKVQTKRWSAQYQIDEFHLAMSGRLIQETETFLRQQMQSLYLLKTKDIIFKTRQINNNEDQRERKERAKELCKIRTQNKKVIDS